MINDIESILVSYKQIDEITTRIANEINDEYKNSDKQLVLICILKGSLMFTCELMKLELDAFLYSFQCEDLFTIIKFHCVNSRWCY